MKKINLYAKREDQQKITKAYLMFKFQSFVSMCIAFELDSCNLKSTLFHCFKSATVYNILEIKRSATSCLD